MTLSRRRFLSLASATLAAPAMSRTAFAADWPKDKIIRAIVPFGAGSTVDIIGRIVADPMAQALGQTIVIENRGGAGGTIGSALAAKADPDGYTVLINAAAHTGAPAVYPHLSYDPAADFSGVAMFGTVPNVLCVAPSKGINTIEEFVANESVPPERFLVEVPAEAAIEFDPGHLHQVMWNLLRNAVRYARAAPGAVRIAARAAGDRVELSVIDNGPGVPGSSQGQLFEPFFTTDSKGTGLGLYLARELCAANRASLEYVRESSGAHFRVVARGAKP